MASPYTAAYRLVSPYGKRTDPLTGQAGVFHAGVDLVGENKDIHSVTDGVVLRSRRITDPSNRTSEWGHYVTVLTPDGKTVHYCHLASRAVEQGERVQSGQLLGKEGSTGRSTGTHLHFEVRENGTPVNPCPLLGIPNEPGRICPAHPKHSPDNTPRVWAEEAVAWAVRTELLRGDETGDFRLHAPCSREEMAVFLYRLYCLIRQPDTENFSQKGGSQ